MLINILLTAFRNMLRNRAFSLINLIGLSVSMSLAMLIILIVKEQYTYDNFHQDGDRIYRVNTRAIKVAGYNEEYASAPLPLGNVIREQYTFAENVVCLNRVFYGEVTQGNVTVPMHGLLVDRSFLEVFNFPLQKGDATTALAEPNGIVLTKKAAEKIFGNAEPVGKMVSITNFGEFIVTGVLAEFESKTHFEFEMLGSTTALPAFERSKKIPAVFGTSLDNWNNYYANYVYFKLKEGRNTAEVEQALAAISKKYYNGLTLAEASNKGFEFYLQGLPDITPGPELGSQMGSGLPTFMIIFLSALAGVILLMSVFNFTNLMIAKSLSRAREIGIRKVVGAQRFQVFVQFIGETIVFSLVALAFSYVFLQFLKTGYLQLPLNEDFSMDLNEDFSLFVIFVLFAIAVGIIAGLLPAGYLSAFRPVNVLKDAGNLKIYSRLTFRKILMVTQFTLSIVFVIVSLVIYSQIDFMLKADYGFDQTNKLNINVGGLPFEKIANEVRGISGVERVGGVSVPLGTYNSLNGNYKRNRQDEPFAMKEISMDDNYIANINLTFVAGRNFDASEQRGREKHIILNESALNQFGFSRPADAIGEIIYADDSLALSVIGVVKDFHSRPLSSRIEPLGLRYNLEKLNYLSAKINPAQKDAVIAAVKTIWKKWSSSNSLEYAMMEDEIDDAYRQAGMQDVLVMVGYITFLAVTLACLGMLGMAMYATQVRVKEVGVRKVMGASVKDVVVLLSKSFMILIRVAVVIGAPVGYFIGTAFLDTFAYKITISPLLLMAATTVIMLLGLVVIASQTIKTALTNPVDSLRYE